MSCVVGEAMCNALHPISPGPKTIATIMYLPVRPYINKSIIHNSDNSYYIIDEEVLKI